ncbi:chaperone protein dnaJ 11, chloroplastic-like [Curcuma longa]|uniref:chaperone protein dnaJ 11, chloroplastic-like n=1 Tax=Curcuma longa TaxID=136217 RepID=UPI003D9E505C
MARSSLVVHQLPAPLPPSAPWRRRLTIRCAAATLYEVLRVPAGATGGEIKAAYRRLALTCHPDVAGAGDEFIRVHAAYATLSDPHKRAEYDHRLMPAAAAAGACSSRQPRRRWETDQCW